MFKNWQKLLRKSGSTFHLLYVLCWWLPWMIGWKLLLLQRCTRAVTETWSSFTDSSEFS
jgi:hypothetical protein